MPETHLDSVKRIVEVFDYLIAHPGDVGVSELSRELGYAKSVTHRLLGTLEAHGYLSSDGKSHRYQFGPKMVRVAATLLNRIDLRSLALPRMVQLRSITRETMLLSLRMGDRRIYVEALDSPEEIRMTVELGRDLPLYLGGGGKAILAFLPIADQERILAEAAGEVVAGGGRVSVGALRADLLAIRERGYASSISERVTGSFSVAAPVFNRLNQVAGSIIIAGPTIRWREELAEHYGALLVAEARGLSADLGCDEKATARLLGGSETPADR